MPEISVIMGTYNEADRKETAAAIDSILQQTFADFEFIICDDGSEMEFYNWLKKYCSKDDRIRLLHSRHNHGPAYARNTCLKRARGVYIAVMDADDCSDARRLEKQLAFLQQHPQYAVVGCNVRLFDGHKIWGVRSMEERPDKKSFLKTMPFVHPSIMLRREVMVELHGYQQSAGFYRVEDYDLLMRLYAKGYQGYNLAEQLFNYREDILAYKKRSYQCRINEFRVRCQGFRALGIRNGNWRYVLKPLFVGLVPTCVMRKIRLVRFSSVKHSKDMNSMIKKGEYKPVWMR